ncbi:nucleoside triphosphate pyrophosphohydrolase [Limnospira fusiformis KN01]|uniref:nucleoside triphosphate pyrophosphohydrolase n=1 Tax=Limnospira TaxID=2596745 RepID=UPI001658A5F0|nr:MULTISPECIES: nucleoside triphosphate pyrophosphohydrolase [Limnospira]MDT9198701.1 nucleoside triphosphate pyrophosphohydrolase [Limnospira sp. PMC 1042.18]ULB47202.1 nucleoside triphosphate pyrophosphohydrolase [Limnospira fusiformis KN01]
MSESSHNQRENDTLNALQELIDVVAKLRSPDGGCPWDLAQTPQSLTPYILEEAYEVVDAIATGDPKAIADELGDLLLQVVLQAQIASESQQFSLADVAAGITEKLIRRHPHVFADVKVESVEEVHENWEAIKDKEAGNHQDSQSLSAKLNRYSRQLPPLIAAMKLSKKTAAVGFEWDNIEGVWDKFHEELAEFEEALHHQDKAEQQAELGDILFVLVNLARWYDIDPHEALRETNHKFIRRFSMVEAACDRPLADYTLAELDVLWDRAKAIIKEQGN